MRCLVVGGSGQDGILTSAQLLAEGNTVVSLSRRPPPLSSVEHVSLDVTNHAAVDEVVRNFRPEQIYYLAAFHRASEDLSPPLELDVSRCLAVNTIAFGALLGSITRHVPGAKTVYASSSRVFGRCAADAVDELTPRAPACIYGISKAAGMGLADVFRREQGLFVSSAILFNHESELRAPAFVAKKIALAALATEVDPQARVEVLSLTDMADWGSARDYARAMRCILDQSESGDYIVASGCLRSVADFAKACFAFVGRDWQDHVRSCPDRREARPSLRGNAGKLRAAGWKPRFTFAEMVEDTMRRLRISQDSGSRLSHEFKDYL